MMPGMDGVEICRRARAAAREPYFYQVLLTARSESQVLAEDMEAGADDYLRKPFVAHELRVRLRAGRRISISKPNSWPPAKRFVSRLRMMLSPASRTAPEFSMLCIPNSARLARERAGGCADG